MKFIHTADLLIGNQFESGMRWEQARKDELFRSLRTLLERAVDEGASLVLISGGLFSHIPVSRELREVSEIFSAFPSLYIIITAGDHDPVTPYAPSLSFEWPDHVYFVRGGGVERVILPDIRTEIFAASERAGFSAGHTGGSGAAGSAGKRTSEGSTTDDYIRDNADRARSAAGEMDFYGENEKLSSPSAADFITAAAKAGESSLVRIAMVPSLSDTAIGDEFRFSGFSYVAAAGSGTCGETEIIPMLAYRPGRLEPMDIDDTGAHGAVIGETDEVSGMLIRAEFVPLASGSYLSLNIRINERTSAAELRAAVERELSKHGPGTIYRLRLSGMRDPEACLDLEELKETHRIREIIDQTEPRYDYARLFREHPQDMIGFYIGTVLGSREDLTSVEQKAIYYGLDALIRTSKEEESS